MKEFIRYKLEKFLPPSYRKFNHPILDIFSDNISNGPKKALLSYTTGGFKAKNGNGLFHNSHLICSEIINTLNLLGYSVDLVDYRDIFFTPSKKYDIFIGHGGINFNKISEKLNSDCKKIYFATGSYWKFHNDEEKRRIEQFTERTGVKAGPDRIIKGDEESALRTSDLIIVLGNSTTKRTYSKFKNVVSLNGIVQNDEWEKDFSNIKDKKRNFLFYSGYGNIHKGLDLLIETFIDTNLNLRVLTNIDKPIKTAYEEHLSRNQNIRLSGWIEYRSQEYYDAVDNSTFIILPSCSEGQAISVCECTNYGLIPIVTTSCGIDIDGYGEIIHPCTSENISSICSRLSSTEESELLRLSKISTDARKRYKRENFRDNFTDIIKQL